MTTAVEAMGVEIPRALAADLRSDHAGEYGAVAIYDGILAVARTPELRKFALEHRETEKRHLAIMEQLVPPASRSRLLAIWRLSGWLLGALPAAIGKQATFATIAAVEQYVEEHYLRQIGQIGANESLADLRSVLVGCCEDEIAHQNDASARLDNPNSGLGKIWQAVVGAGSALAVSLARRI